MSVRPYVRSSVPRPSLAVHLGLWLLQNTNKKPGGSVAEWLACWTQAQKEIAVATLSGNGLRQTVHTQCRVAGNTV